MHVSLLANYWWAALLGIVVAVGVFVLIAGRHAEGGFGWRARLGWAKWRDLSRRAADLQARIILTVFFFTLAAPFGLVQTYLADSLRLKPSRRARTWLPRLTRDLTLGDARKQF